jgi:hypothetical protein
MRTINISTLSVTMAIILVSTTMIGVALAEPAEPAEHDKHPAASQDARFAFLKDLQGTWQAEADNEDKPGVTFEFSVIAGGAAVQEIEMKGTPMEMMTIYHMDDDQLVGTHYCMLGNRPFVHADKAVVDGSLSFTCDGKPGNTKSHAEKHVHAWTIALDDTGKLSYTGSVMHEDKLSETPAFVLTRQ